MTKFQHEATLCTNFFWRRFASLHYVDDIFGDDISRVGISLFDILLPTLKNVSILLHFEFLIFIVLGLFLVFKYFDSAFFSYTMASEWPHRTCHRAFQPASFPASCRLCISDDIYWNNS